MDRIILFFLGSILLLSGCKNSKQPEGYNSVNIIEYINIYDENNRILTAQGTEYDYLYFGDNKDKGILAATNNFIKKYSYDNDSSCYTVEEPLSESLLKTMRYTENTIEELVLKNNKPMFEGERYLTSEELCSILKISRRTLQYYRGDGIFPFIQLPGKVLFRESDIRKVLEDSFRSAYNIEDYSL